MFRLKYKNYIPALFILIFSCYTIFSSPGYAQEFYKVSDKIGGSSGSTGQAQDNSNDNTTLIIIGAAVIAGVLVYKLVLDKDEPKKDEKKDSTSNQSLLIRQLNKSNNNIASEIKKLQQDSN